MLGEHRVVIVGGGFGGLEAAKALRRAPVKTTLIDRRNFFLFQPLLYQVATGGLSPGDISAALRSIVRKQKNTETLLAEVVDFDVAKRKVILRDGEAEYDSLIVASGSVLHYFGNPEWERLAPGLKTVEDATAIRKRIFLAFEAAEREPDPEIRREWLTFAIVGAGPTGVELAGALSEIANDSLKGDFRSIDSREAQILLLEAGPRILPAFSPDLTAKAERDLIRLGVRPLVGVRVTAIDDRGLTYEADGRTGRLAARTVIWAAGVRASGLGRLLAERTGAKTDRSGRVIVEPDLSVPGYPEIFVIGDLANYPHQTGSPLPGLAPVAMQQGRYVAKVIEARLKGRQPPAFHYLDKGSLATIGREKAVAEFGRIRLTGRLAWLAWLFVHLMYLVGFENRVVVFVQWAFQYFTFNRRARLITGEVDIPLRTPARQTTDQDSAPGANGCAARGVAGETRKR